MSLGWYVRRLANMSPAEILHRLREHASRKLSSRRQWGWADFTGHRLALVSLEPLRLAFVARVDAGLADRIRQACDKLLAGEFQALGQAWPLRPVENLFPRELWRLDPVTGGLWSGADCFCFDIPYRHEKTLGDVKYVWEINRLQFLQPLAAQVALNGDPRALAALEAAIESWHASSPPFRGLGWNSGIELALRTATLIVVLTLCGAALGDATRARIAQILAAQLFWIHKFPSRFSSANNHRIAELMALFVTPLVLPDYPEAKAIQARAEQELIREANLQFFSDGVPAEQSPTYGAFSAEMLIFAAGMAVNSDQNLVQALRPRMLAFAEHIRWLADSKGSVPAIGDDDEGRVITLDASSEAQYPVSVGAAIAGLFGEKACPAPVVQPELRLAWFGSPSAFQAPVMGARSFGEGGYSIIREEIAGQRAHVVLDHGPLGYLSIAAHGHADSGSLLLALNDEPVFVDPGTYLYHSGRAWRDWFRGTRAHNTMTFADLDQSVISGPFNWSHKANSRGGVQRHGEEWELVAEHDGYRRRLGGIHRRSVRKVPNGLAVTDNWDGPEGIKASFVLQCAAGLDASLVDGGFAIQRRGEPVAVVKFSAPGQLSARAGGEIGTGGWISARFGEKTPATRLTWDGLLPNGELTTTILWGHQQDE